MADPDPPRKVFATGASGFIGAALVRPLRALGNEVVSVDMKIASEQVPLRGTPTISRRP